MGLHKPNKMNKEDMTNTTGAVRDYMNSASEKEKTELKGQQKWGLFETNYQRNKGISTDQSLQEIEDFCQGGVTVTAGGQEWSTTSGSGARGQAGGNFGAGGQAGGGFGGQGGVAFGTVQPGSLATAGTTTRGTMPGGGNMKFEDRSAGGASFFASHQAKEAKKYQPESKW